MKVDILVSVIIPVYNVEAYLICCLQSVLQQKYTNIEIIIVNDGSTDNSINIAKAFCEKDNRFYLINQENEGLSAARNAGLKKAKGDYIFYLDSDDYIAEDCIFNLVNAAKEYAAEIVQANFYYDYPSYLLYDMIVKEKSIVFSRDEAMQELLKQKIIKNFAWGKLIMASIAKKYPFEKGKFYEDTFWKFYIVHACTKYIVLTTPMLFYMQRPSSISGGFSIKNLDQLEGESLRLQFLKANYTLAYYKMGLKSLNDKILLHLSLLEHLNNYEKKIYYNALLLYIKKYHLDKVFKFRYFVLNRHILNVIFIFYKKIQRKLVANNWVKINKNND